METEKLEYCPYCGRCGAHHFNDHRNENEKVRGQIAGLVIQQHTADKKDGELWWMIFTSNQ